jgi:L,D-transpeptidase ErfK/SrfK
MRAMRWRIALLLLAMIGGGARAAPAPGVRVYDAIAGGEREYTVVPGDSLWAISGRFTMSRALLDALNPLPDPDRLRPGTRLVISDRHIVPRRDPNGIVIDLADRTLFWFERGALKARLPVAIGRSGWATPPGRYRIVGRREHPVWRVPASIQEEMRARGEEVVTMVPPGPENPLGRYWIQLSAPGYGLHGTNAPASIGKYATHGCLRLFPQDIERVYHEARDGTPVEVIHEPIKVARDRGGAVHLEVHRDVYGGGGPDLARARAHLEAAGLLGRVDPGRVADVVARAWGAPEDVSAPAASAGRPAVAPAAAQ